MLETFQIIMFLVVLLILIYVLIGRVIERFRVIACVDRRYTSFTNPASALLWAGSSECSSISSTGVT